MKVALITGRLASSKAWEQAKLLEGIGYSVDVIAAPVDVALFIPPSRIADLVSGKNYDIVVVPGRWRHDTKALETKLGTRVVRGPTHIDDLYWVAKKLPIEQWDAELAAEELVVESNMRRIKEWYFEGSRKTPFFQSSFSNVKIPSVPPPIIPVAEVYPGDDVESKIMRVVELGYEALVLGYYEEQDLDTIERHVNIIEKLGFNGIIGVDGLTPATQGKLARGDSSVELYLSVNPETAWIYARDPEVWKDKLLVTLPFAPGHEIATKDIVKRLEDTVRVLEREGIHHTLIDVSLPPPGVSSILDKLSTLKTSVKLLGKPGFTGVSNIVELFDADSPGLIALMTALSIEAGSVMMLVTEESVKTRGVFNEALESSMLTSYAYANNRPPKDLGLNLLYLKRKRDPTLKPQGQRKTVGREKGFTSQPVGGWDPGGSVVITIDHANCSILYKWFDEEDWYEAGSWRDAAEHIYSTRRLTHLGHALYLGRELFKAELSIRLCRGYIQDEDFLQGKTLCCDTKHT